MTQFISADLEETTQYLKSFADNHEEQPYFTFGTIEDITAEATGGDDFKYPCLWLDLPQIITEDNQQNNAMERYVFSVTAFYAGESDSKQSRLQAYNKSIKILKSLQNKLNEDSQSAIIYCELDGMKKVPLNPALFNSSHYGYILYFEVLFYDNQSLR